jgi:hypothetical protein
VLASDLGVYLRRLIDKPLAEHLPELRGISVAVFFDGVANRDREHFVLGARDSDATVAVAGHAPAVDHLAGGVGHISLLTSTSGRTVGVAGAVQYSLRFLTPQGTYERIVPTMRPQ